MKPLGKKNYDRLKFITQIGLPAFGTLYFALAGIWGLPSAEKIIGTIVAIDTFLGVCLHLSTNAYNNSDEKYDGVVKPLGEIDGVGNFVMDFKPHIDAQHVENSKEIILKVEKPLEK